MKILIVITKSELGGAQVFALNLARGLKKAGEEVVVAGGPGTYLPVELEKDNIPFKRLEKLERSHNPFKNLSFVKELSTYVKANKFDVVHLNSANALFGVWGALNTKVVFTVHGLSLLDSGHKAFSLLKTAYRLFFRTAFKKLDQIVFVSKLNLDFAKSSGLISGLETKSHLVYNGLDLESLLSREEARKKLRLNADDYIYGSIGRLAYPKNYEFLINAYLDVKAIKPQAKLLIIGEGPERGKYENLIKLYKLEDSVILTGEIVDASHYLKAFDLFVLPSIFEGLSLSLIAAVQAGIPALASRVGGNEDVIGVNNCFKLDDREAFIKLIKRNTFEIEQKIDFSADKMVSSYLEVYSI
jgi:Glycosyltransferase